MYSSESTVLVLIDVQGKLATLMHGRDDLFESLELLIKGMNILDIPIIWMEQLPDKLGPTLPNLAQLMPGREPIAKHTFSCCGNAKFMETFNELNRRQVLLAGIESHICVYQTGVDLIQAGYEVQVVADCVSSRKKYNRKLGIKRIAEAGGSVTSTEMIFFELMKAAQGDAFKQMVKIIK